MATIRTARPEDERAIVACVHDAYVGYIARIGAPPGPMRDDYAALIASGVVYVLTEDDEIRGLVVTMPEDDCRLLANIAVDPRQQGRGLGRQLLAFVEQLARENGRDAIRLYTHEKMTENLALYARWGFVETDRRTEYGFRRVYMRKELASDATPVRET